MVLAEAEERFTLMLRKLLLLVLSVVALAGCQAGMQGPPKIIYGPDCPPGPKPCPRDYPDFPLPPGGPYLKTPPRGAPMAGYSTPDKLDLAVKSGK